MTSILLFRFFKYTALLMLAAATAGAFLPEQETTRKRAVYLLGTVGLALTWMAGFGLLRNGGVSMGAPWITGPVLLSIAWFHTLVWSVESPKRRRPLWAGVASALLLTALALMIVRPG